MMKRLGIVRWRLYFIKVFVNRSLSVNDKYTQALEKEYSEEDGIEDEDVDYEEATDILYSYQEIVCRAALGELNSIIEYELKLAAQNVRKQNDVNAKRKKIKSREAAVKILQEDGLVIEQLPGYSVIEEVRKIINSFKHDDGYSGRFRDFAGPYVGLEERYELDPDRILSFIDKVDEFVLAVYKRYPDIKEEPRLKFNLNNLKE